MRLWCRKEANAISYSGAAHFGYEGHPAQIGNQLKIQHISRLICEVIDSFCSLL